MGGVGLCPIDEYKIFREVLGGLQSSNPAWYQQLTGHLSENQGKALTEVITLANQRQAAKESKAIEQQGGQAENISYCQIHIQISLHFQKRIPARPLNHSPP